MKSLFCVALLFASSVFADASNWSVMDVTRISAYICGDAVPCNNNECLDGCSYIDTTDSSVVPAFGGVAFVDVSPSGFIEHLQISATILTGGIQYPYQRQIMVDSYTSGQKILNGSMWVNGIGWVPGVSVHLYQIQHDKLKMMIEYGDPEQSEWYALNSAL